MAVNKDSRMVDAPGDYHDASLAEQELDEKFPNRPCNHSKTLPFHDLFLTLFDPLNENKKKPTGPKIARKKQGPHGPSNLSPHEVRRNIIDRFISRWRKEVGNDIYPAFRLIIPEKDRERAMYGLKEKAIGKLLVKVMGINKNSPDARDLLNWKLPGQNAAASRMAGDFAGRCFDVIAKRPILTEVGSMTITEVNDLLDKLSAAQKEDTQIPVFEQFYSKMNADELMWLIRIILRQMKMGATEKTFFDIWHPDAESLFNVSSSLRRVCWDLYNPSFRLNGDDRAITLMQCFQPQLAQFQMHSIQKMIDRMRPTEDDMTFWIEEKLDGERMQLHMISDDSVPGGKKFGFWSRKAKDYTYLYGNSFLDENSALTRHIQEAFDTGVQNIVLDGEMITWDPELDAMVPFGTLKTAALSEQRNPYSSTTQRPLYRVFDILFLNGQALTNYSLRERRRALEESIKSVHRRMEVHQYTEAHTAEEVEAVLKTVIDEASEGLVLKNPRSAYRLNERNDDWMKVKPEYMTGYGESFDCIVIGGYYGSGHRGGNLSSFLCGLKVGENQISQGANDMKCWSFFKVGGGFTAQDYANIRHQTDGRWKEWDPKRPPTDFIELAGGHLQYERPDVWIKPCDSIVLSIKCASIQQTDQFRMGLTLRFPKFTKLRDDRDWTSALTIQGFLNQKNSIDRELKEKAFQIDDSRRKRVKIHRKKPVTVAGGEEIVNIPYGGPETSLFEGLNFYIMTESLRPQKKSKAELEQLVKANGGKIFQTHNASNGTICIGDRRVVYAASLIKTGKADIVRPAWLFDCIKQSEIDVSRPKLLLPFEPGHMFFTREESKASLEENIDEYGDSYVRDVTVEELKEVLLSIVPSISLRLRRKQIIDQMPEKFEYNFEAQSFRDELEHHGEGLGDLPGWIFERSVLYVDEYTVEGTKGNLWYNEGDIPDERLRVKQAVDTARFAGAKVVHDVEDETITHIVVGADRDRVKTLRKQTSRRERLPRLVTIEWIEQSSAEKTLLNEERFAPY